MQVSFQVNIFHLIPIKAVINPVPEHKCNVYWLKINWSRDSIIVKILNLYIIFYVLTCITSPVINYPRRCVISLTLQWKTPKCLYSGDPNYWLVRYFDTTKVLNHWVLFFRGTFHNMFQTLHTCTYSCIGTSGKEIVQKPLERVLAKKHCRGYCWQLCTVVNPSTEFKQYEERMVVRDVNEKTCTYEDRPNVRDLKKISEC